MSTFIALLRGINVGKAKRVPMVELRALLSGLGYTGVSTLVNSGNAVFRAQMGSPAQHAASIASAISNQFQFEVPVIVKSAKQLTTIINENPVTAETGQHSRLLVVFAQNKNLLAGLEGIETLATPPEKFEVGKNAAYLFCPKGILESKAGAALLGKAGKTITTRNWATVLKLQALANKSVG